MDEVRSYPSFRWSHSKCSSCLPCDQCMGCPWGGLDFSEGLFEYFSPLSAGVLYGTWWYNDNGGDQTTSTWTPPSTTWEPPATTSTSDYTPPSPTTSSTPVYTPPPTTSSTPAYTPPPTTSTTSTTSSATSSVNLNTALTSGLAVSTGAVSAPSTTNPENILVMNNIVIQYGIILSEVVKNE